MVVSKDMAGNPISDELYFIGIGGVGMSGIAKIAHIQGIKVSGSDVKRSRFTNALEEVGIPVHYGHSPDNVPDGYPTVVVSTAIQQDNPEYVCARNRGLNIVHRAQMLAYLGRNLSTLAVAGTHGKTTTSSALAATLEFMGLSPTVLVGGMMKLYGSNASSGSGKYYVVEADESDKSFTCLNPSAMIITNIEADHLDHYSDIDEIYNVFGRFIELLPPDGPCVVCAHDIKLVDLAKHHARRVLTYGFSDEIAQRLGYLPVEAAHASHPIDFLVVDEHTEGITSHFTLQLANDKSVTTKISQNPGAHNVLNGSAVLGLIYALGLDIDDAAEALAKFQGVYRRFDLVGVERGIHVVDDYAHHPTEIAATIAAAKTLGFKRIHVVFQPHRYSRAALFTGVLKDEFARAFDGADFLTFMNVYPAGETPIPGISGKTFLNVVLEHPGHPKATYVARRTNVAEHVAQRLESGDLVITMGAGDVTEVGRLILDYIKKQGDSPDSAWKSSARQGSGHFSSFPEYTVADAEEEEDA